MVDPGGAPAVSMRSRSVGVDREIHAPKRVNPGLSGLRLMSACAYEDRTKQRLIAREASAHSPLMIGG